MIRWPVGSPEAGSVVERATRWVEEGEAMKTARTWVPPYPNPSALRRDLRAMLAVVEAAQEYVDLMDSEGMADDDAMRSALAALHSQAETVRPDA
jgi:hypothetical protein